MDALGNFGKMFGAILETILMVYRAWEVYLMKQVGVFFCSGFFILKPKEHTWVAIPTAWLDPLVSMAPEEPRYPHVTLCLCST